MEDFRNDYLLSRQEYGRLFPYIADDNVTEILWNGRSLWIDDKNKGRYMAPEKLSEAQAGHLSMLIANRSGMMYGPVNPVLSWDTEKMSICVLSEYVSKNGATFIFKKRNNDRRFTAKSMTDSGFCTEDDIAEIKEIVKENTSFVICGEKCTEKVELLRFMMRYIPVSDRVISMENEGKLSLVSGDSDKDVMEIEMTTGDIKNDLARLCAGFSPDRLMGMLSSQVMAAEIVRIMDEMAISCGMIVGGRDLKDGLDRLRPTVDGREYKWICDGWFRLFPVVIELGDKGIRRIIHK
ncbi:MAG: hypothetical protein IJS24_07390 [Eubacterium sp.]|nr:hypothetical protein [Eubacterium sp.]